MASYNVELNNKPGKDGRHLLLIRVTMDRRHKRISLVRYVPKRDFNRNGKYGLWIRTSSIDHREVNEHIKSKITELQKRESDLENEGTATSLNLLLNDLRQPLGKDVFEFTKKEIARHKTRGQYQTSVKKQHVLNKISEFHGSEDLNFKGLNMTFLRDYQSYWTSKGNKNNTIQADFKIMRSIIKSAIMEGLISSDLNPFDRYKLRFDKTNRDKLDETELKKIVDVKLKPESLEWHARNMFMFSYLCAGIRFGDTLQLRWHNVTGDHLTYTMSKTKDPHVVLLTEEAVSILDRYRNNESKSDDYIFPLLKKNIDYSDPEFLIRQISSKNVLVNKYLRKILKKTDITKKVSFHISRHSFAYMAIRKTGDVYGVSKSLNHKNLHTTETYLKQNDSSATDEIMQRVFGN